MRNARHALLGALLLVSCASASSSSPHNPTPHPHDVVLTAGHTYEKNPAVTLAREYWLIIAAADGTRFMVPRPDGDPRIAEECRSRGPLSPSFESAISARAPRPKRRSRA